MSDIESMKAELEAAGYQFGTAGNSIHYPKCYLVIHTPDGLRINSKLYPVGDTNPIEKQESIEKAYAHLQREKKFAAMEALLEDIAYNVKGADNDALDQWIIESKLLLGK